MGCHEWARRLTQPADKVWTVQVWKEFEQAFEFELRTSLQQDKVELDKVKEEIEGHWVPDDEPGKKCAADARKWSFQLQKQLDVTKELLKKSANDNYKFDGDGELKSKYGASTLRQEGFGQDAVKFFEKAYDELKKQYDDAVKFGKISDKTKFQVPWKQFWGHNAAIVRINTLSNQMPTPHKATIDKSYDDTTFIAHYWKHVLFRASWEPHEVASMWSPGYVVDHGFDDDLRVKLCSHECKFGVNPQRGDEAYFKWLELHNVVSSFVRGNAESPCWLVGDLAIVDAGDKGTEVIVSKCYVPCKSVVATFQNLFTKEDDSEQSWKVAMYTMTPLHPTSGEVEGSFLLNGHPYELCPQAQDDFARDYADLPPAVQNGNIHKFNIKNVDGNGTSISASQVKFPSCFEYGNGAVALGDVENVFYVTVTETTYTLSNQKGCGDAALTYQKYDVSLAF